MQRGGVGIVSERLGRRLFVGSDSGLCLPCGLIKSVSQAVSINGSQSGGSLRSPKARGGA